MHARAGRPAGKRRSTRWVVVVCAVALLPSTGVWAGPAHGDATYGAKSVQTFALPVGHCGNCHQRHHQGPSLLPPAPDGVTCFNCHDARGTLQAGGPVLNTSYSARAGASLPLGPTDVAGRFRTDAGSAILSSHELAGLQRWMQGREANPCEACHDPHRAQGDPLGQGLAAKTPGQRGAPLSRPRQTAGEPRTLWGDDPGEKMDTGLGALRYQAPLRVAGWGYEPAGEAFGDGSNLTDFVTFCTACHAQPDVFSTARGRLLAPIDWSAERHGRAAAWDRAGSSEMVAPYVDGQLGRYVLSCTDCHEPHGSPNVALVRESVNGGPVQLTEFDGGTPRRLCVRCHQSLGDGHHTLKGSCTVCHPRVGPDGLFISRTCTDCHRHGNTLMVPGVTHDGGPLF